jgi:hypothetical protein
VTLAGSDEDRKPPSSSIVLRMVMETTFWFFGRIIAIERSVFEMKG